MTDIEAHDCGGCPLSSRRDFLRELGLGAATLFASLGVVRSAGAMLPALPVSAGTARRRDGAMRVYEVPGADGVQIDKENQVILARWAGSVFAFNLSCPHQNTALRWDNTDHRFHCPKHHSQYQSNGEFIDGRATRGMDRLGISRSGAGVVVDVDKLYQQDRDPAGWAAAVVKV
jgi:Rieske Fe-S protein